MTDLIQCPYCKRSNFKSQRGLSHHLSRDKVCFSKSHQGATGRTAPLASAPNDGAMRRSKRAKTQPFQDKTAEEIHLSSTESSGGASESDPDQVKKFEQNEDDFTHSSASVEHNGWENEESDDERDCDEANPPNATMRDEFLECCDFARVQCLDLPAPKKTSPQSMDLLRRNESPLCAFEDVLVWHLKCAKKLRHDQSL